MIEIIPAMDLIDGKCVRLTHGDFTRKTVYSDDPLETAKRFESAGLRRLHMVDLDGARNGRPENFAVLDSVAGGTGLTIDFGGGIRTEADLRAAFAAGADIVNVGSVAAQDPDTFADWVTRFGPESMLLAADCKGEQVSVKGWSADGAVSILDLLKRSVQVGATTAFVTDIGRDGALGGPSIDLYRRILGSVPGLNLIASGGVSAVGDVARLESVGCSGVIVGKAIYEGRISLEELSAYAR